MRAHTSGRRHGGLVAVEFALVLGVFLLLLFGVLEVARMVYVFNALQEVTRRAAAAAATTDFTDAAALQQVRQDAVFRSTAGTLALGAPVSDQNVVIDYLALSKAGDGSLTLTPMVSLPASPAQSRLACLGNPYDANCIQFVRVRVCAAADALSCQAMSLPSVFPMVGFAVTLPKATTIVKADALGLDGVTP